MANPGKAVVNATEAAAKAGDNAPSRPKAGGARAAKPQYNDIDPATLSDMSPEARGRLRGMADEMRMPLPQLFELEYKLKPDLVQAGYPQKTIQGLLTSSDPYGSVQSFLADESAVMRQSLKDARIPGWDDATIDSLSFRDLKGTFDDYNNPKSKFRKSLEKNGGIRGKVEEDNVQTVESRLPPQETATPPAKEKPKGKLASNYLATGDTRFAESGYTPPGMFRDIVSVPADYRAIATPGGGIPKPYAADLPQPQPPTQSMEELMRNFAPMVEGKNGPKRMKVDPQAEVDPRRAALQMQEAPAPQPGSPVIDPIVVGRDFRPGAVVGVAEARAASPSVQPAPAPEVAAGAGPLPEPPAEPTALEKSIKGSKWVKRGQAVKDYIGGMNAVDAAITGTLVGVPTIAIGSAMMSGGGQPQQQTQSAYPPQRPMLSYEDIKRMEADRRAKAAPQAQPPMQAPPAQMMQPAPAGVGPRRDQSTEIIRQMRMGRMS